MAPPDPRPLLAALGRRDFLRAAAAVTAAGGLAGCGTSAAPGSVAAALPDGPLQPGAGDIPGDHYLGSDPADVRWGYVPAIGAAPVLTMRSGQTVTIDTVSHEGILEDQGRDPVAWFGRHGVAADGVLSDAVAVARDYRRTPRDFDADGPHVITGPVFVEGARPGDVLKVETLSAVPRVPYGVVSSRHGKGALGRTASGAPPAGIALDEVMPPPATDGRATGDPGRYGNVSVFTPVRDGADGPEAHLAFGEGQEVSFGLRPFMGTMGVAHVAADAENAAELNSIPPTLGGGNIDIRLLGPDSAFYLPVRAEGALFHVGDPHLAMGDGEVALTALEGSLRATFRLTVCRPGEGTAPSVAFGYPFGETPDAWVPIGLSDPDGSIGGQGTDLDVAMRRAVVNALDFLQEDRGMDRATAYAYLSAAADFAVSQVVDRTVGVHGVIPKAHFRS
ncbi:acetamidase/formamidase family protein [Pseudonocardia sp. DR1-2]|uniref:acetamidase/formamidase family protein n=1 Tax=Pseudonocardia sp. DR1-2 TaxID=2951168 RepID=UPI002043B4B7|nr:acetamidase/formamidase family protein [Pseudonocardia sp. DR1-2]MCM3847360.1 acetamidase/formamidase family protein [Pseudonocardia sp. DR1-2]